MKVWVIQYVDYNFVSPEGVYSSKKRARAAIPEGYFKAYDITEFELDAPRRDQ